MYCNPFKCEFSYSFVFAAADKISADINRRTPNYVWRTDGQTDERDAMRDAAGGTDEDPTVVGDGRVLDLARPVF